MAKIFIIYFITFLISCTQKANLVNKDPSCLRYFDQSLKMLVYSAPSEVAEYPKGATQTMALILRDFVYPEQDELQLKATICFVVDENGKLKDVRIFKKELSSYSRLDNELVKAFRQLKNWKPAYCNGKKVASLVVIPIGLEVNDG